MTSENKPAIGFIGLGIMGNRMLTSMEMHGKFNLALAWDPSEAACKAAAETYAGLQIAESADAVINSPDTDVIYIASPPEAHAEYSLAAAAAGKPIYCEKPLGIDVPASRDLVEKIEASGIKNIVNFSLASARAANVIEQAVKSGELGEISGVDVRLHFSRWPRDWQSGATWLSERAEGGYIREVFSHYAFLTARIFGTTELVDSSVCYPEDPKLCETHFLALLDCGGIPVSVAGGSGGKGPDRVEFTVMGSKKSYRLWDWNQLQSATGDEWVDELTDRADPRVEGYMRTLDNVHNMIMDKPHNMPTFREALNVQELVEEICSS